MKIQFSIWLLVFGYVIDFVGSWMRIVHRPYADFLLAVSAIIKLTGLILVAYFFLSHPRVKEFLESGGNEIHK